MNDRASSSDIVPIASWREALFLITILELVLSLGAFLELFHAKAKCVLRTGVSGDEQSYCQKH